MRCMPKQERKAIVYTLLAVIVLCGGVSFYFRLYGLTFLCLFTAAFVAARYVLARFVYDIRLRGDEDTTGAAVGYASIRDVPFYLLDLAVLRGYAGREGVVQCRLSLGDLKEAVLVGNGRGVKRELREKYKMENGGRFPIFDYTLTPWTADAIILVFADGERYIGVMLEADERFCGFFEVIG